MVFHEPVERLIRIRRSCRTYLKKQIEPTTLNVLTEAFTVINRGPTGERIKFHIVTLDDHALEGIDPYDFSLIINPVSFIAPVVRESPMAYETCGYAMEFIVLKAADLHLGTCWLGYFNPAFFKDIPLAPGEILPAVCVVGYAAELPEESDRTRWENIFFVEDFYSPISEESAGKYGASLEMVRLAPSSGNTQPWRIVKEKYRDTFHFFKKSIDAHYEAKKLHNIDLGIAMCHFELVSRKNGLGGKWKKVEPMIYPVSRKTEYIISWVGNP